MIRAVCPDCHEWSFVLDGVSACCGAKAVVRGAVQRRESVTAMNRHQPTAKAQTKQLIEQDHRCAYCERSLTAVVWDHFLPWSYSGDSSDENFVAACPDCNAMKGSKVFSNVGEARADLHPPSRQGAPQASPIPRFART